MKTWYDSIFIRKSMRKYDKRMALTGEEKAGVERQIQQLIPLDSSIKVRVELVKREQTNALAGEYCLLFYSEQKPGYLENAGYMLEQMDLYFASKQIGACWYGMAAPRQQAPDELEYVIMLAFGKCKLQDFRQSVSQFKRKKVAAFWKGDFEPAVVKAVRLAPSACNTQPWQVVCRAGKLEVYRKTKTRTLIPVRALPVLNQIDMGIFLCFLDVALEHAGIRFTKTQLAEKETVDNLEMVAAYILED